MYHSQFATHLRPIWGFDVSVLIINSKQLYHRKKLFELSCDSHRSVAEYKNQSYGSKYGNIAQRKRLYGALKTIKRAALLLSIRS